MVKHCGLTLDTVGNAAKMAERRMVKGGHKLLDARVHALLDTLHNSAHTITPGELCRLVRDNLLDYRDELQSARHK